MYSQNDEEKFILDYFIDLGERGGKFLDIGGYDPFKFSNTRALYEKGWTGVYVEPSPICFARFKKEYEKEQNRIQLLNYAITEANGEVTLHEANGDAVSTISYEHKAKWEQGSGVKYTPVQIAAMSMTNLINTYGNDVIFLSLDVEGTNLQLFNLIPDEFLHRLNCICVEHDRHQEQMKQRLSLFGFKLLICNNENLIMGK